MTELEDLTGRVDSIEAAVITAIAELTAKVAALEAEPEPEAPKPPPPPLRWADRADKDGWEELVKWVDDLNRSYSLSREYTIQPCWPAHPGMVEELHALHMAWIAATIADSKNGPQPEEPAEGKKPAKPAKPAKGGADYSVWHDRALWPFLDRLIENRYRITMCSHDDHVPETGNDLPVETDRSFIPTI
jgi:hypothetical protein